jgi:hypothetical protein
VKEEDLEISLTGNRLAISGKREAEKHEQGETYYASERSYGSFSRAFTLPDGTDAENVKGRAEERRVAGDRPEEARSAAEEDHDQQGGGWQQGEGLTRPFVPPRCSSPRPRGRGRGVEDEMQELLIAARCQHPSWGPRKLLAWLERRHRGRHFPAPSSVGDLLRRRGLVKPRRRRRRVQPRVARPGRYDAPNATWCADFKGWFRTGDGERCDPLTISDGYSRFVLGCHIVERPTLEHVQPQFERVFVEYGLPTAIRTDNGPPFASTGLGGLSRLAVWWLRLGITPDRIEPGAPSRMGDTSAFTRRSRTRRLRRCIDPRSTAATIRSLHTEYNEDRHTSLWLTTHQPTSTRHHVGPSSDLT